MRTAPRKSVGREVEELAPYLRAARSYGPLGRDEEHALSVRARRGEVEARQTLIRHNLAFVVAVACKHRRGGLRLDDLIQEGNIGLMRAIDKFDPHAGTRFSTYAVWWIRAYISKYLQQARSLVRPRTGRVAQADLSLDGGPDEEGSRHFLDCLADDAPGPEDRYLSAEGDSGVRRQLGRMRKRIGKVGWDIVHSRLSQDSPATLEGIGARWGVSRERVRQVEFTTRELLRKQLLAAGCAP